MFCVIQSFFLSHLNHKASYLNMTGINQSKYIFVVPSHNSAIFLTLLLSDYLNKRKCRAANCLPHTPRIVTNCCFCCLFFSLSRKWNKTTTKNICSLQLSCIYALVICWLTCFRSFFKRGGRELNAIIVLPHCRQPPIPSHGTPSPISHIKANSIQEKSRFSFVFLLSDSPSRFFSLIWSQANYL